jgi:hypothetical protein
MTASIVCGAGVPHVPVFPSLARSGDDGIRARYETVRRALDRARPSLLICVATDHLNAFFLDRVPTFALYVGDRVSGPIDDVPGVRRARLATDPDAAESLAGGIVEAGFDLLVCREGEVDHSVVVPLHFLCRPELPVIVLLVNAYVPPLPSARRCHDIGAAIAAAVAELPVDRRVGVIASGSFSQEVGGPRVDPGRAWSVPRPDWADRVSNAFASGDVEGVLAEATPAMLADAGSVAGELLAWIVMLGAVRAGGARMDATVDHRPGEAFAYGSWTGR